MKLGQYTISRQGSQATFSGANCFGMYALAGEYCFPTIEATITFINRFDGGGDASNRIFIANSNGEKRPVRH
jgi:hypothetical protein